jgi:hypothetical protein
VTEREKAIAKVRKLRALAARPGTEAEGKAARARAAKVMLRHGLSEQDVAPAHRPQPRPRPWPQWAPPVPATTVTSATTGAVFNATGNIYIRFG